MNAELDGTVGPILKTYADRAGVVYTDADGDQPGVQMNLYRFVRGHRRAPGAVREHQGPARPLPQPDDAGGLRAQVGPEPADGHVLRRRDEDLVRAGDRRQRDRDARRQARACTASSSRPGRRSSEAAQRFSVEELDRRRRDRRLRRRRRRPRPASSSSERTTTRRSATTSTSTSSARGRSTASTRPTTSATSRCRPRSRAPCCSATRRWRRPAGRCVEVVTAAKTDLERRLDDRRPGRLRDLRAGRERGRGARRAPAADRPRRGLRPAGATSSATRCSPTTTSRSPRAAWSIGCAPSRTTAF